METDKPHDPRGTRSKIIFFLKFLEIRLRFVFILIVTALVVGYWTNIQNYFERWQRNWSSRTHAGHEHGTAESEFEFFCPMHPFVIRDHPGKCPVCGMDLVQRKKGAPMQLPQGTLARVQVSPDRIMQAGIQVEPVGYQLLTRVVRTYGVIEPDETRVAKITARFPGRIDKLMVNSMGLTVARGDSLAEIYSPKFLAATQEYAQAVRGARRLAADPAAGAEEKRRGAQLADSARQRLQLAGFTEEQLDDVVSEGQSGETVTLHSPVSGIVLEKNVMLGETMEEGATLYTIADLSKLWVQAYVVESELAAVKPGMAAEVSTISYPGEIFYGTVDFIYPTVNTENRSVKVRVAVENEQSKLKPGMYVTAVMRSPIGRLIELDSSPAQTSPAMTSPIAFGEPVKLPTTDQAEADRFLASLAPDSDYFFCPMHPEVVSSKQDDCPKCGMHLKPKKLEAAQTNVAGNANSEQWAEGYSCPMHPDELSGKSGVCIVCDCGMKLQKIRVEKVLAVPEQAIIDTGTRHVVYVESSPGVYDSRAVVLGPRAGTFYPVLDGLKAGDRIVARGSFLIDAEARLNPATATTAPTPPDENKHEDEVR